MKSAENRAKVIDVQRSFLSTKGFNVNWIQSNFQISFINSPQLQNIQFVAAHRSFIRKGPLMKVCRKSVKLRWFFLFNDVLVYAANIGQNFNLHQFLPTSSLDISDVPDSTTHQFAFHISNPKKSFKVFAASQEEKVQWLLDLITAIGEEKQKKETFRKSGLRSIENNVEFVAPVWV